jgi:endonuclease V-like protein UPF0215 family
VEKRGIRVFGIAESFKETDTTSTLAGVVVRRDLIIDGFVFSDVAIKGNDSTQKILSMFHSLKRNDINCIMLDGLIISIYNIIDAEEIAAKTGVPVIAITFRPSVGLDQTLERNFPHDSKQKLEQYRRLGQREKILLRTGKSIYLRYWGIRSREAIVVVNAFTLQGAVPEPIRIAKLAARATARFSNTRLFSGTTSTRGRV